MAHKQPLAIFDIDGTLFRSSLVIELVNELVSRTIFPAAVEKDIESDYRAWVNRKGSYENYIQAVVRTYRKHIIGCKEKDIATAVKSVIDQQKDKLYRFTRDLITSLRQRSYYLVALSGSPIPIVSRFAESIGFDTYCGTTYEVRNGYIVSSGDMIQKKQELESLLAKGTHLMKGSIAVGDTEGDIPILEMVDHAIAFNPNARLATHAQAQGWDIVIERKDVVIRPLSWTFIKKSEDVLIDLRPNS